ncbi:hypothetical protein EYF80_051243 [Liparis tanakae]|uniref:Uncharacterized protein n=1 Tax=Liparis tanakae TaxID=230148 RepID=A0A4Z2FCG8_9TELE|nr:hypothetical protein EYF80_051243 [Liparis tanakae]
MGNTPSGLHSPDSSALPCSTHPVMEGLVRYRTPSLTSQRHVGQTDGQLHTGGAGDNKRLTPPPLYFANHRQAPSTSMHGATL